MTSTYHIRSLFCQSPVYSIYTYCLSPLAVLSTYPSYHIYPICFIYLSINFLEQHLDCHCHAPFPPARNCEKNSYPPRLGLHHGCDQGESKWGITDPHSTGAIDSYAIYGQLWWLFMVIKPLIQLVDTWTMIAATFSGASELSSGEFSQKWLGEDPKNQRCRKSWGSCWCLTQGAT